MKCKKCGTTLILAMPIENVSELYWCPNLSCGIVQIITVKEREKCQEEQEETASIQLK